MKKLLSLLLICCLVMTMTTPVSADYYWLKDVNADDFVNALVDYCNGNTVHNMTDFDFDLSNHDFKAYGVKKTNDSLEFRFDCEGLYAFFPLPLPPIPLPCPAFYRFEGLMYVDNPQDGLKKPYTLDITNKDKNVRAAGENWMLYMWNTSNTRFKV